MVNGPVVNIVKTKVSPEHAPKAYRISPDHLNLKPNSQIGNANNVVKFQNKNQGGMLVNYMKSQEHLQFRRRADINEASFGQSTQQTRISDQSMNQT